MPTFETRIATLERRDRLTQEHAQPWVPPSRADVAAFLTPLLPIYAACGLLTGPVLDEPAIAAALAALPWPEPTHEPVSL